MKNTNKTKSYENHHIVTAEVNDTKMTLTISHTDTNTPLKTMIYETLKKEYPDIKPDDIKNINILYEEYNNTIPIQYINNKKTDITSVFFF